MAADPARARRQAGPSPCSAAAYPHPDAARHRPQPASRRRIGIAFPRSRGCGKRQRYPPSPRWACPNSGSGAGSPHVWSCARGRSGPCSIPGWSASTPAAGRRPDRRIGAGTRPESDSRERPRSRTGNSGQGPTSARPSLPAGYLSRWQKTGTAPGERSGYCTVLRAELWKLHKRIPPLENCAGI